MIWKRNIAISIQRIKAIFSFDLSYSVMSSAFQITDRSKNAFLKSCTNLFFIEVFTKNINKNCLDWKSIKTYEDPASVKS